MTFEQLTEIRTGVDADTARPDFHSVCVKTMAIASRSRLYAWVVGAYTSTVTNVLKARELLVPATRQRVANGTPDHVNLCIGSCC